jgi:hypothetical protein
MEISYVNNNKSYLDPLLLHNVQQLRVHFSRPFHRFRMDEVIVAPMRRVLLLFPLYIHLERSRRMVFDWKEMMIWGVFGSEDLEVFARIFHFAHQKSQKKSIFITFKKVR